MEEQFEKKQGAKKPKHEKNLKNQLEDLDQYDEQELAILKRVGLAA